MAKVINNLEVAGGASAAVVTVSQRVGEFFFAKSGSTIRGVLPVVQGTVVDGAIDYPVWASKYPEFVSGNDIVFPAEVAGITLRNLGGEAAAEGVFQDHAVESHTHGLYNLSGSIGSGAGPGGFGYRGFNNNGTQSTAPNGANVDADETRMKNFGYQLYTIVDDYEVQNVIVGLTVDLTGAQDGSTFKYDLPNNQLVPVDPAGTGLNDGDYVVWDAANAEFVQAPQYSFFTLAEIIAGVSMSPATPGSTLIAPSTTPTNAGEVSIFSIQRRPMTNGMTQIHVQMRVFEDDEFRLVFDNSILGPGGFIMDCYGNIVDETINDGTHGPGVYIIGASTIAINRLDVLDGVTNLRVTFNVV